MPRKRYLISYDIADDKRRTHVFNLLSGEGDHVQYSVFLAECTRTELARLRARLTEQIHQREDQVLIIDMGPAEHPLDQGLDVLGKPYLPPTRVLVI